MKREKLTFTEAVNTLSDRAEIELPKYEKPGGRTGYEVLDLAAKFYADSLTSASHTYLERRKIGSSDMRNAEST